MYKGLYTSYKTEYNFPKEFKIHVLKRINDLCRIIEKDKNNKIIIASEDKINSSQERVVLNTSG